MPRRTTAKSRKGCMTCKIRRVKCDETHPSCQRCTDTGRNCDGYMNNLIVKINKPSVQTQTKTFINRTQSQIQAFQFFIARLLPGMSRIVKGDFWDRYLLQTAHSETSVWLALNSMSELIRQVANETSISRCSARTALKWYGQSLQELQLILERQSGWSSICGITAILYLCIESLLRNLQGAINIYTLAMQSLIPLEAEWRKDPVHNSIRELFYHITVANGLSLPHVSPGNVFPVKFSSISEARHALESLVGPAQKTVLGIERARKDQARSWQPSQEMIDQRNRILEQFSQWKDAADLLRDEIASNDDDDDRLNWSAMYIAHLAYLIWLSAVPDGRIEMAFDNYFREFEMMLIHGETIVDLCGGEQTLFSFETRVVKLLTLVASRCRHPVLRRKALELLRRGPRIENISRAVDAVRMCQAFIAYEESGGIDEPFHEQPLSLDLPQAHNRIAWASDKQLVNNDGSVSIFVTFGKWKINQRGEWHLTEEIIEM